MQDKICLVARHTESSIENFWHNVELVSSLNDTNLISILLLGYYKLKHNNSPEDLEKELRSRNSSYSLHIIHLQEKREILSLIRSNKGQLIQCRYINKEKPYLKSHQSEYVLEVKKNTKPIKPSLLKKAGIFIRNLPEKQEIVVGLKQNERHLKISTEEQHSLKEYFFKILYSNEQNKITEYQTNKDNTIYTIVNNEGIIICNIGVYHRFIDDELTDYFLLINNM